MVNLKQAKNITLQGELDLLSDDFNQTLQCYRLVAFSIKSSYIDLLLLEVANASAFFGGVACALEHSSNHCFLS